MRPRGEGRPSRLSLDHGGKPVDLELVRRREEVVLSILAISSAIPGTGESERREEMSREGMPGLTEDPAFDRTCAAVKFAFPPAEADATEVLGTIVENALARTCAADAPMFEPTVDPAPTAAPPRPKPPRAAAKSASKLKAAAQPEATAAAPQAEHERKRNALEFCASQGNAAAQYESAMIAARTDRKKAVLWLRRAADQEHAGYNRCVTAVKWARANANLPFHSRIGLGPRRTDFQEAL